MGWENWSGFLLVEMIWGGGCPEAAGRVAGLEKLAPLARPPPHPSSYGCPPAQLGPLPDRPGAGPVQSAQMFVFNK